MLTFSVFNSFYSKIKFSSASVHPRFLQNINEMKSLKKYNDKNTVKRSSVIANHFEQIGQFITLN